MDKIIYMDNAATTRTLPAVVDEMLPYFSELYGNPSSVYGFADKSRNAVKTAREIIAKSLNTKPDTIYFTAGGSESDNWAVIETAHAYKKKGRHIITSQIEHHAILHSCEYLETCGYDVTYVNVDENGTIKLDELVKAIRPDTILISIMFANNEIGTIQPIYEIGQIARKYGIIFHTDAVQAYGQIPIDVEKYNIDMLSASGHKLNGPKGTGFLYIRDGINIKSFIHGGAQESGRRAGTENVPGIAGLGKAVEIAFQSMDDKMKHETNLRDYIIKYVTEHIPYCRLNGHLTNRLPNNTNFSFQFIDGETLRVMLDMSGICTSGGSACTSGSASPSHVLTAIGLPRDIAGGSIRLTISHETTMEEVQTVCAILSDTIDKLRSTSPLYEDFLNR
ncbi:MAG: cysteine desulfurase NifS [Lachnospiraceae bacterium]|nr:cysteine desulfurase NifS [Lachnospiraceae bacterium]